MLPIDMLDRHLLPVTCVLTGLDSMARVGRFLRVLHPHVFVLHRVVVLVDRLAAGSVPDDFPASGAFASTLRQIGAWLRLAAEHLIVGDNSFS